MESTQVDEKKKSKIVHSIRSQLVPMGADSAVIPNKCVAEIVHAKDIMDESGSPAWFMGFMPWRDRKIPILNVPLMADKKVDMSEARRHQIVVLNSHAEVSGVEFFGVLSTGVPRMLELNSTNVKHNPEQKLLTSYVMCNVDIMARAHTGEDAVNSEPAEGDKSAHAGDMRNIPGFILNIKHLEKCVREFAK